MSSPKSLDRKSGRKQSFSHQRSSNEDIYQQDELYDTPVRYIIIIIIYCNISIIIKKIISHWLRNFFFFLETLVINMNKLFVVRNILVISLVFSKIRWFILTMYQFGDDSRIDSRDEVKLLLAIFRFRFRSWSCYHRLNSFALGLKIVTLSLYVFLRCLFILCIVFITCLLLLNVYRETNDMLFRFYFYVIRLFDNNILNYII